jgi:hypothetical protein
MAFTVHSPPPKQHSLPAEPANPRRGRNRREVPLNPYSIL